MALQSARYKQDFSLGPPNTEKKADGFSVIRLWSNGGGDR
jgi:hypothetical protein